MKKLSSPSPLLFFLLFSHSTPAKLPSSSPSSSLPYCFATWWKVFIVASPAASGHGPPRPSVLFFVKRGSARERGDLIGRVFPNCGKPPFPVDPGYERDLIKTKRERTGENNWSAFVWIAGSSGLLFLRSSFYLAISGLFNLMEQLGLPATTFILPRYVHPVSRNDKNFDS